MKKKSRIGLIRVLVQNGVLGLLFLFAACDTIPPATPTPIDPGRRLPTPAISPQIEGVTGTSSSNQQDNGAPTVVGEEQEAVASPTPPGGDGTSLQTPVTATVIAAETVTPTRNSGLPTTTTIPSPTATTP